MGVGAGEVGAAVGVGVVRMRGDVSGYHAVRLRFGAFHSWGFEIVSAEEERDKVRRG